MWGSFKGKEDLRAASARASASIALPRLMGHTPPHRSRGILSQEHAAHRGARRDTARAMSRENVERLADHVVVATRQRGRGRQSGIEVTMEFTFLFTLQDKKITEWRLFVHEAQALEAAGLQE